MANSHAVADRSTSKVTRAAKAVSGALSRAEHLCREGGVKLTASRRRILEILAAEGRPLGAYDLIEKVAQTSAKRPAPISIYRALDFLLENGLVHRLASRNAYLACGHGHAQSEPVVFLICDTCGEVEEATSEPLRRDLAELADRAEFAPRVPVMEIAGSCRLCLRDPEKTAATKESEQAHEHK
jgi:Fur family transcriptional regulator, zinc uptake regulator